MLAVRLQEPPVSRVVPYEAAMSLIDAVDSTFGPCRPGWVSMGRGGWSSHVR